MSRSNPYEHNRWDAEVIHVILYGLHWDLMSARQGVRDALVKTHAAEVDSYADSGRAVLQKWLGDLNRLRDQIDMLLSDAGNLRTEIIRTTGCDGECSKKARQRTKTDQEPANGLQTAPEGES